MTLKASNQAKAPLCAAFVESLREVFGEVAVLYVEENGFKLGTSEDNGRRTEARHKAVTSGERDTRAAHL